MSSLIRRMEIRRLKAAGYQRAKFRLQHNTDGNVSRVPVRRGGLIIDPNGKAVGYRWPRRAVA